MDTMRKYCKDELPKGCLDCQKEDGFGDICHAYQAYQQGRADERAKTIDEIIDIIAVACKFDEDNRIEMKQYILEHLKGSNDAKSPCCNCMTDETCCCGCPEYFEWKKQNG